MPRRSKRMVLLSELGDAVVSHHVFANLHKLSMFPSSAPIGVSNGSLVGLTAEEDWCIVSTGVVF